MNICARALRSGRTGVVLPDDILKRDLNLISKQVGRPFIILFDECNVLRNSRVILEQLRNLFMNMQGYMLVLSGTKDLFPVIDEVFSPIARQFRKIEIDAFREPGHVATCIHKPLSLIGVSSQQARHLVPRAIVRDIYLLSGGRPYEVQLIAHFLFKQCQAGQAKQFTLDLRNVQRMQKELSGTQNVESRPIIQTARRLKRESLFALAALIFSREKVSLDECIQCEQVVFGSTRMTADGLIREHALLADEGVISRDPNALEFLGGRS